MGRGARGFPPYDPQQRGSDGAMTRTGPGTLILTVKRALPVVVKLLHRYQSFPDLELIPSFKAGRRLTNHVSMLTIPNLARTRREGPSSPFPL